MAHFSLEDLELPISLFVGVLAGMAYLLSFARRASKPFTLVDGLIVVALMAIITAVVMPLVEGVSAEARSTALLQNLHAIRNQIERYKLDHRGEPPLLFQGRFPQLEQATDIAGKPGPPGRVYAFGPYLPEGIPPNPVNGSREVRLTEQFPPVKATGGGWLYHQATGRITADVPALLDH